MSWTKKWRQDPTLPPPPTGLGNSFEAASSALIDRRRFKFNPRSWWWFLYSKVWYFCANMTFPVHENNFSQHVCMYFLFASVVHNMRRSRILLYFSRSVVAYFYLKYLIMQKFFLRCTVKVRAIQVVPLVQTFHLLLLLLSPYPLLHRSFSLSMCIACDETRGGGIETAHRKSKSISDERCFLSSNLIGISCKKHPPLHSVFLPPSKT